MPAALTLSPSGIGPVEATWGGFARPGAYLLVGSARQGRLHLAAHAAGGSLADGKEARPTLLLSAREPGEVVSLAKEAGVDLAEAYGRGRVRLLRMPPPAQLAALGEDGLARALADLAGAARGAARIVIEDFSSFVLFRSLDAFAVAFRRFLGAIAEHGATLVLGLGEPANDGSRRLLALVEAEVTGSLRLGTGPGGPELRLVPGTGHAGQSAEAPWSPSGAPPPSLFTEAPLFAEAPLAAAAAPPAAPPSPAPVAPPLPEPAAPAASFEEEDDPFAHSADGYAGTDAAALDAGAFVVSASPTDPFGYPGTSPSVRPEPAAGTPATEPAVTDPFALAVAVEPEEASPPEETPQHEPVPVAEAAPDAFLPPEGEDDGWAPIQPVALPPSSPVVLPPGLDPLGTGFLVDSTAPGQGARPGTDPSPGAEILPGADGFAGPVRSLETPAQSGDEDPEVAFQQDLAAAFAARATTPFLLVALRLEPGSPFFGTFPLVADGLLGVLTGNDRALVRDDEAKLAVLLPGAGAETPQRLLAAVRAHLEGVLGEETDAALRSVGVLVLPNGEPFTTPQELIAYAMG